MEEIRKKITDFMENVATGPLTFRGLLRALRHGHPMEHEGDLLCREGLLMALLALGRETQARRLQEVWAADDQTTWSRRDDG